MLIDTMPSEQTERALKEAQRIAQRIRTKANYHSLVTELSDIKVGDKVTFINALDIVYKDVEIIRITTNQRIFFPVTFMGITRERGYFLSDHGVDAPRATANAIFKDKNDAVRYYNSAEYQAAKRAQIKYNAERRG